MPNDEATSELISRSLSNAISAEQQEVVDQQLQHNQQSRNFARLSRLIQGSLSDVGRRSMDGDESVAPGLSADAKERLRHRMREASASLSQAGNTVTPEQTPSHTMKMSSDFQESDFLPQGESTAHEERTVRTRYTLLKKIGQGGLGTVWLARDEKLKRSVALKEMNVKASEIPRAWHRFHREAEITGHLEHPNIVPMHHFGMDDVTGQPFYAMRFVGKRTLVDAIEAYHDRRTAGEDVTMDLHHLLTAFIGTCQAIAYANSRGVVHRDLKPENIAIDSFGQVIVLDWGLAKISAEYEAEGLLSGDSALSEASLADTMAGEVIGTPLYMSPEQAAGTLDEIDHRTDVYGLGAVLFAILTGYAPHENSGRNQDSQKLPIAEMLKKISSGPTPHPRDYRLGIPSELESICACAMQFKQHSRYQSAEAVAEAVQRWIAGHSERKQKFATSRSDARELRIAVLSAVKDLERNVRFMARLPPIQGIADVIAGRDGDSLATWRERLAVIYHGLLRTNSDFSSVAYLQCDGDQFQELIRMERQASDDSNVRSIPASRLKSGPLTTCMQEAISGDPDEVHISLASECPESNVRTAADTNRISAIVPVFDSQTEEVFGMVVIEAALDKLIEQQIRGRFSMINQLWLIDHDGRLLIQIDSTGNRIRQYEGRNMNDLVVESGASDMWQAATEQLRHSCEFVDELDHEFYATRIELVQGRYSLTLAMCLRDKQKS